MATINSPSSSCTFRFSILRGLRYQY